MLLRELLSAPAVLIQAYRTSWNSDRLPFWVRGDRLGHFFGQIPEDPMPDGRESWPQAFRELSIFLGIGLILLVQTYLPLDKSGSGWQRAFGVVAPVLMALPLPVFSVGLLRGLPRWAYPSAGMLLGYTLLQAAFSSLLPFTITIFLAALGLVIVATRVNTRIRPLPVSLQRLGSSLWSDWRRVSFGVYGMTPLLIILAFDDGRANNQTPYLALLMMCMLLGALAVIRSRKPEQQVLALLAGLTLSIWLAALDKAAFGGGLAGWTSSG